MPPPSSLPLPFPLCVSCHPCPCVTIPIPCVVVSVCVCVCEACHMHCVWWLALSNTLPCCAPSSLLFSFCPSLFHHHHLKQTQRDVERREGERSGWGKRKKRKKRGVMQKRVEKGGKKRKRDYDTWCSQVVSNPSTNQARRGLTSLIRREVVLSSWYGRNSLFLSLFFFHNQILWASARVPTGSVPATQSQKREVGTIALWPHARAC